jgi:hypothetical protein
VSFFTALPLLSVNALPTEEWRSLVSAWRETPYVPNYAYRLSHLYRHAGRKDLAEELVQIAMRLDHDRPDALWLMAQEQIRLGDFSGWDWYRTRFADPLFRLGHSYDEWFQGRTMWDGSEDLSGKSLLVIQEQGHGDFLQMLRYIPAAKRICEKIYVYVHPSMYRLAHAAYGDILEPHDPRAIRNPAHARKLVPDTDRHIGIMSLPGIFGPLARDDLVMPWPLKEPGKDLGGIGLVWRGNPKNLNDSNRSMPREAFERLCEALTPVAGLSPLYSFQIGEGADWRARVRPEDPTRLEDLCYQLPPSSGDWFDTAKSLRRIDRLVTIDSAVMHLAASMGVETWGLLCYPHDWRFPETGEMPEWYPTLRLIRQERPGDWDSAIRVLLDRMGSERHTITRERESAPRTLGL